MKFYSIPFHDVDLNDMVLCKTIGDALERNYPGWGWMVRPFSEKGGGIVEIKMQWMQGHILRPFSFIIKYDELTNTYDMVRDLAVQAGGELLERCNLPRARFNGQEVRHIDGVHQSLMYSSYDRMII